MAHFISETVIHFKIMKFMLQLFFPLKTKMIFYVLNTAIKVKNQYSL